MNEAPLVLFTTCVPVAVGLAGCCAVLGGDALTALVALVLASVGMAGSIFHLAKPLRAPTSLRGLKGSPLSQEIGAVVVFWALLFVWVAMEGAPLAGSIGIIDLAPASAAAMPAAARVVCMLAALWGMVLLCVINRAYRVPTRPAWDGAEGLGELAGVACGVGGGLYGLLSSATRAFAASEAALFSAADGALGASMVSEALAPCALACVFAACCAFCPRRWQVRLQCAAAAGDERAADAAVAVAEQTRVFRRASLLAVAGVAFSLLAVALCAASAAGAFAVICRSVAAAAELAAAVVLRAAFYSIPAPARTVRPLRK